MTNYDKATGSSGTMRITDTGTTVEFWINSGNSSTFDHELPWAYVVNGVTSSWREYDYNAGAGWERLGVWTVSTTQTVTFKLAATGTSGFGGPTTHSVTINRASIPNAPSTPTLSAITSTSINVVFTDGANNGAAIDTRQILRNYTNSISGGIAVTSDGSTNITGLASGVTYYFWARTHNSVGWSPYSASRSATTLRVPDAPNSPIISEISQVSFVASFTDNGNGGSAITAREIAYGTSSSAPSTSVSYTGVTTVTGLSPATTYYVWTRVQNAVGWSPYSPSVVIRTIAGAYVNVGGIQKEAIPYVKDAGVWKLARPWGRIAGVWKETT